MELVRILHNKVIIGVGVAIKTDDSYLIYCQNRLVLVTYDKHSIQMEKLSSYIVIPEWDELINKESLTSDLKLLEVL